MIDRHFCLALTVAATLSACATIDFDTPKRRSTAYNDTDTTRMGRGVEPLASAHPEQSGFILQTDGIEALATRLLLAARAERSIDAQYYLITNDVTGRLFVESLLQAADRGIRIRLLLDDIQTQGYDVGLSALDSHPNFEIRVFNPFARGARYLNAVGSFSRINRRMHNKTFTVDNQLTIIGGRNIAAEYFAARSDVNFGDLDAVAIGPLVKEVSTQFDTYWNDRYAVPVPAFIDPPDDLSTSLTQLRERLVLSRKEARKSPYAGALGRAVEFVDDISDDDFTWAPYQLVYDSPAKARGDDLREDQSILPPLRETILGAESEFWLVSPYFVPRRSGTEALLELRASGVEVKIVTNSLASNNHAIVHTGYLPSRKPLLKGGVELYEARPDIAVTGADQWHGGHVSEGTLHTKGFVVDREELFLGSFNWDPRSAYINTELGVIIRSPELASTIAELLDTKLRSRTYEVILDDRGELRWIAYDDGERKEFSKEPNTSWWERFTVTLMRVLPIEGQL